MNISEAKRIRIVDFLQSLGYAPVRVCNHQYWYLSPYREEQSASFKVNDRLNEWYDFGLSEGGGIIELVMQLYRLSTVHEALRTIESRLSVSLPVHTRMPRFDTDIEEAMKDVRVLDLNHHALLSYLHSRGIDTDIARKYCKEIHYELRKRHYFSIAFENVSGGYEIRNPYYKGCIRKKDISFIGHIAEERQKHVCVYEGFMDFLSFLTLQRKGDTVACVQVPCDHVVMNSVSNLKRALQVLEPYSYIHCYLDNDMAGQKTVETIVGLHGIGAINETARYAEYKDLNDYLRGKKR
ncbi:toprim domain-containing protein [Phocaeicola dorei]|uniref:toprim domain-containing protein n=1 Tax=Phocaeicola dorei TaxID=357276 RepID=UPI001C3838F3|nr:toprim domain-containing protein [Phocaeicola dorei]MBV4239274.1 toprim domain-containing protein [Phocaeicola dorei]MCB6462019.1 toprim domain-containing protein [Phocaeicola dorei]MCB6747448.1 toprim domain-containing protein [Phocaeicola dorei]MCB6772765.1 toprim domain-containing protein [Phocaeicola dorei]MCB6791696.1 toprim domain-containing protein [Phocaeicola dorei]